MMIIRELGWDDMIHQIAKLLTRRLVHQDIIEFDSYAIYLFGMELLVLTLFEMMILVMVGIILDKLPQMMVFVLTFALIRVYAGGYHSKSAWKCISIFTTVAVLVTFLYWNYPYADYVTIIISIIATSIISRYAPVQTKNRPLSREEQVQYGNKARRISVSFLILIVIFTLSSNGFLHSSAYLASYAMLFEAITLIPFINQKGGEERETSDAICSRNGKESS